MNTQAFSVREKKVEGLGFEGGLAKKAILKIQTQYGIVIHSSPSNI